MTTSYKSKAPTESTENLIVRKQSPASSPANPDATQTCVVYEQVGNIFSVKQLTALERARHTIVNVEGKTRCTFFCIHASNVPIVRYYEDTVGDVWWNVDFKVLGVKVLYDRMRGKEYTQTIYLKKNDAWTRGLERDVCPVFVRPRFC